MPVPSDANARRFYRAAFQRMEDARYLFAADRTTAAVYLAGYCVECILKALVVAQAPPGDRDEVVKAFRGVRAHDYGWLRQRYRECGGAAMPPMIVRRFTEVGFWATDFRYKPETVAQADARSFLAAAIEILGWADGRL